MDVHDTLASHAVRGGGGIELHVVETGPADGRPILFLHGYSQSHLSWSKQLCSTLADEFRLVAMDHRGHGSSEKPRDAYDDPELWAADVRAVVETLDLDDVVLVTWSYAGLIALDYLEEYGTGRLAGLNMVNAVSEIGTESSLEFLDPGYLELMPGLCSADTGECIEALERFVDRCVHGELPPKEHYFVLGFNAVVPPHVRESLRDRVVDHGDTLSSVDVPVLLTHGEEDAVVLPSIADHHAELVGDARVSLYPETGHSPFWEEPERFDEELREFARAL